MANLKTCAACVALLALLVCVHWVQAQKTIKSSFQQSYSSGSGGGGSNPQSVYGGYGANEQQSSLAGDRRRTSGLVAPVGQQQRRTQQSYATRQKTESVRQPAYQQQQQQQPQQQEQQEQYSSSSSSSSSYEQQAEADAEPPSYGAVQGSPGQDFPNYARVPKTSFSCDGLPYDYGMYADEETGCQAYHLCYNGRKESFLCGPGTVFNQRILHCDYWYSVECGKSSQYYSSNAYMGSSQPEPGPAEANAAPPAQRPLAQSSYKRTEIASSSVNRPVAPSQYQRDQQQQQSASSFSRNTQQVQESY